MSENEGGPIICEATNGIDMGEASDVSPAHASVTDSQATERAIHPHPFDFKAYSAEDAQLSPDRTTITIRSDHLVSDPVALEAFIAHQSKLPPRPTVRILATRRAEKDRIITLFDIRLDLFRHVVPTTEDQRRWAYVKASGAEHVRIPLQDIGEEKLSSKQPDPLGAAFAFRRFCASSARAKQFALTRSVSNWDTEHIKEHLTFLIKPLFSRSAKLQITFPTLYSTIHIQPSPANNAFVTGIKNLFTSPETHEPISIVWPMATTPRSGISGLNTPTREVLLQNEDAWLDEWKDAIFAAMAGRRQGWLGDSDKLDAAMISSKQVSEILRKIL